MAGANYMGGKRNWAKARARDTAGRAQRGHFGRQRIGVLSRGLSGPSGQGTDAGRVAADALSAISLAHAFYNGQRTQQNASPSTTAVRANSPPLARSNHTTSTPLRRIQRSKVLNLLDASAPVSIRAELDQILHVPDLAGLSKCPSVSRSPPLAGSRSPEPNFTNTLVDVDCKQYELGVKSPSAEVSSRAHIPSDFRHSNEDLDDSGFFEFNQFAPGDTSSSDLGLGGSSNGAASPMRSPFYSFKRASSVPHGHSRVKCPVFTSDFRKDTLVQYLLPSTSGASEMLPAHDDCTDNVPGSHNPGHSHEPGALYNILDEPNPWLTLGRILDLPSWTRIESPPATRTREATKHQISPTSAGVFSTGSRGSCPGLASGDSQRSAHDCPADYHDSVTAVMYGESPQHDTAARSSFSATRCPVTAHVFEQDDEPDDTGLNRTFMPHSSLPRISSLSDAQELQSPLHPLSAKADFMRKASRFAPSVDGTLYAIAAPSPPDMMRSNLREQGSVWPSGHLRDSATHTAHIDSDPNAYTPVSSAREEPSGMFAIDIAPSTVGFEPDCYAEVSPLPPPATPRQTLPASSPDGFSQMPVHSARKHWVIPTKGVAAHRSLASAKKSLLASPVRRMSSSPSFSSSAGLSVRAASSAAENEFQSSSELGLPISIGTTHHEATLPAPGSSLACDAVAHEPIPLENCAMPCAVPPTPEQILTAKSLMTVAGSPRRTSYFEGPSLFCDQEENEEED